MDSDQGHKIVATSLTAKNASNQDDEFADLTQNERAARVIERAIMEGELKPGEKLGVHQLATRYGLGITPIREGLSRLTHRGFVIATDNRGFRVADATAEDFADLTQLRMSVELDALRRSIRQGDDRWEADVLGAMHRLERAVMRSGTTDAGISDHLHKAFHMVLLSACGSPRMLELSSLLFDQAYRYRRLFFGGFNVSADDFVSEHRTIVETALSRDADKAAALHAEHINRPLILLYPDVASVATRTANSS